MSPTRMPAAGFLIVCFSLAAAAAADDWGPADNGLRISFAVARTDGGKGRDVRVQFENVGESDILIPLGVRTDQPHPTAIRLFVRTPDGATPRVIYTGLGSIGGYAEPLTMGLFAGETYTMSIPMERYYVLDGSEKLTRFVTRRCRLWVELEVSEAQCPKPGELEGLRKTLGCWQGKVVSNELQFPR